jgi:hypothetical protein
MSTTKLVIANKSNKQAMTEWEEFLLSISNSTTIDLNETEDDKRKRIKKLEKPGNEEEWIQYYFPKFANCKPAKFQIKSTLTVIRAKRLYQRRAWARGLAKSTRRMFEIFYKMFVQKMRINMLLISKNEGNAIRLLAPYRANLEANQRLINDYGTQQGSKWAEEEFVTRKKSSFRAVGMGQNPRGARLDELRINVLVFDDADDDEVCRNPDRLQQNWEWVEKSAIPTVDIANDYFIFFDNNIIAEDSLAVRAAAYADDVELVNIRDDEGKSVWPEKNSEADIDYMLSKISYTSGQGEYFNDGTPTGKVFPQMKWGKCPPLKSLPFVVVYADPSPSNKDKPTLKSKAQNSCKAVVVVGYKDLKFYVYKCFVDITTNSNFIDWLYATRDYIGTSTQSYFFIENNTLQGPFYEQVLLPLIFEKGKEKGSVLGITPDERVKPEKYFRIEGTLEPKNRLGLLILNEDEKDDAHMKRLEGQFKKVSPNCKQMDGPDATEGAVWITEHKIVAVQAAGGIETFKRSPNKKRF